MGGGSPAFPSWQYGRFLKSIRNPELAAVIAGDPPKQRPRLLALRKWILTTAKSTEAVGPIEERLKWVKSAYLTSQTNCRASIRCQKEVQ